MEGKALKLPTQVVPVRLAMIGREALACELYVAESARLGHSQLLDDVAAMFDEDAEFIPVRQPGGVQLLNKLTIAWLALRRHEDRPSRDFGDEPSEVIRLYDRQHLIDVELINGVTIAGTSLHSAPSDRPRLVDHLNRARRFVRVWTSDEHYLINKSQIASVTERSWSSE